MLKLISRWVPFPLVYASSYICKRKMIKYGQSYKTKREISSVIRARFESMEALIPIGWESYLKSMYGDYMKLPPLEKRKGHQGNRIPDPFSPCGHTDVLFWKDRSTQN